MPGTSNRYWAPSENLFSESGKSYASPGGMPIFSRNRLLSFILQIPLKECFLIPEVLEEFIYFIKVFFYIPDMPHDPITVVNRFIPIQCEGYKFVFKLFFQDRVFRLAFRQIHPLGIILTGIGSNFYSS